MTTTTDADDGTPPPIRALAVSSGGSLVVAGTDDGTVRAWDLDTTEEVWSGRTGSPVSSVAIAPTGSMLVLGADDGTLHVWDLVTGRPRREPWTGHRGPVSALAMPSSDARVVSGGADGFLGVWDPSTGRPVGKPLLGHRGRVGSVAISPDGSRVVSGGDDASLRVWDTETSRQIGEPWTGHDGPVAAVVIEVELEQLFTMSRLGSQVASAGVDGTLRRWDLATGRPDGEVRIGHAGTVPSVAITRYGTRAVTGGTDGAVRVWDLATGRPVGGPRTGHTGTVRAVTVAAEGALAVSGGDDGTVRVWDLAGEAPALVLPPASARGAASGSAPLGRPVSRPSAGHSARIWAVAFTSDGSRVVSGSGDRTVRVWDPATGRAVGEPWVHENPVLALAVNGARVVTGDSAGSLRWWDLDRGQPEGEARTGHGGPVRAVAVSSDGARVVSGSNDRTLRLWESATGRPVGDPWTGHEGGIRSVAFSPEGTRLVSGGADGTLRCWDPGTGHPLGDPWTASAGGVRCAAFTPDGARVVAGYADGTLRLWDPTTGRPVGEPWTGHRPPVRAVAVSPDGARVLSGGEDATVRVWDLAGRPLGGPWTGHGQAVLSVAISPDGSRVASGSEDGAVGFWTWDVPAPPRPVQRHAGVRSDAAGVEDLLGMGEDAATMAALLAAVGTRPPLSVALMGNWGSGKSTFMRLVQQQVDAYADTARRYPISAYAAHVRQVRFNAWHYSDDHLWVGLVEHLFRELREDDPAPGATAGADRIELEAALAEQKAQQGRLDARLRAVDDLDPEIGWWGPLGQLRHSAIVLRAAGDEARHQWRRALLLPVLLLVLAVGVAAAAVVLGDAVALWVRGLGWTTGAAALLAAVSARARAAFRVARDHTDAARARLLADRARRAEAIAGLERDLTARDPARQLDALLAEITAPERYGGYRGLTGRIHHDLRRLSDQLALAREHDRPALRRIVLYIDDLDRCAPGRVVEVLQAVNLMLSMDLFVVVVAVDPRWLLRALDEHHGRLLHTRPGTEADAPPGRDAGLHGRPLDYLDKIFHVPYAIRPMSGHATDYRRRLLPAVAPEEVTDRRPRERGLDPVEVREEYEAARDGTFAEVTGEATGPAVGTPPGVSTTPGPARWAPPPDVQSLQLQPHEAAWLPRLAPLIATPRGVKKLANTYRLLRISVPEAELDGFLGDQERGGPYQAAGLLLAAIVSEPGQARQLLVDLHGADPDHDIVETLTGSGPLAGTLAAFVTAARRTGPVHGSTRTYQLWARTVARYSFETYDLFSGPTAAR